MERRDLKLAEAAHRAAGHMPEGRGGGVSAFEAFVEALEAELGKDGIRIVRVGEAARAHPAGD